MGAELKSVQATRVILFSREALPVTGGVFTARCRQCTSAYEAAAELLAEPAAALVIDLRCLATGNLRLVQTARKQGVAVLAFGKLSAAMSTEGLDGVQLVSQEGLAQALARLAQGARAAEQEAPEKQPVEATAVGVGGEAAPEAAPPREAAAGLDRPGQEASSAEPKRQGPPSSVLTADELAALLGEEP